MARALAPALLLLAACSASSRPPELMAGSTPEDEASRLRIEMRVELGASYTIEQVAEAFLVAAWGKRDFDRARETVERIAGYLRRDFVSVLPPRTVRVYCLPDRGTYEHFVQSSCRRAPTTPYGFYLPGERRMLLNLATGTGTLAHEIAHPILTEDFPRIPTWFNEGFASLFEQSSTDDDGTVRGHPNWRIRSLREAAKRGSLLSFADLVKTTPEDFYRDSRGLNYATARFLVLYLQEKGLLRRFYRSFRSGVEADPTGGTTLESVTGRTLEELDREWREWLAGLP